MTDRQILLLLEQAYKQAIKKIDLEIVRLQSSPETQSKIHQLKYQKALRIQVQTILDEFKYRQFISINDYMNRCYTDSFIATLMELHQQDIPLLFPINQVEMVRAIQHNTKLSKPLYKVLGINVDKLNKTIAMEITKGISTGESWRDISRNIRRKTNKLSIGKSKVIAATEGHRIGQEARHDVGAKSKKAGADILKQWDATLDMKTRSDHQWLDGQIVEFDDYFVVGGYRALYPGGFCVAKEDVNCRCVVNYRARWALGEQELQTLKERAELYGIDKDDSFEEFKEKYMNYVKDNR